MYGNYNRCGLETRKKVEFHVSCGNKLRAMIKRITRFAIALAPIWFSGCVTLVDDSTMGEQRANADLVKSEVRKLSEQVAEMRQSVARLEEEFRSLQGSRASDAKDQRARIDDLERSLKMVEASRDQLKQEIVDSISKRVADLMKV